MEISVLRRKNPLYVDKNIMGHIYENGKENLVLRFIQKHFIKINLNKNTFNENVAIYTNKRNNFPLHLPHK